MSNKPLITASLFLIIFISGCAGGGGEGTAGGTNLSITVATGAPVIGAAVTVIDSNGNSEDCSSTTNSSGQVTCSLTKATNPPYMIKAQQLSNILYAVVPDSTSKSINVTPVSSVMAQKFASDNNLTPSQIVSNPSSMPTSASSAQAAVDLVNAIVKTIATQSGLTVNNALTQSYDPTSTTDSLDKLVHNINLSTDSTGVNISIPTATGTVSVSIAFTANTTQAAFALNTTLTSNTPNLSDADAIDAVFAKFLNDLSNCDTASKAEMLSLMTGTYNNGYTNADWVSNVCSNGIGTLTRTYTKTIARFDDKALILGGLKLSSGDTFEVGFAFQKINGTWKMLGDEMPIDTSISTRHALTYAVSDGSWGNRGGFLQYQRYIDLWVNTDTSRIVAGHVPASIELYAIPIKNASDQWKNSNFPTTPVATLYKASTSLNCGSLFTTTPPTSSTYNTSCGDNIAQDSNSNYANFFTILEANDYTLVVMKNKDSNGVCLNCDSNQIPKSGTLLGKAIPFSQLFGTSLTSNQLSSGISISNVTQDFENKARQYFAAPSDNDLTNYISNLLSTALTNVLNVNWVKSAIGKNSGLNLWGSVSPCGTNQAWVNLTTPNHTVGGTSYGFNYPVTNKTFNNAGYISLALSNSINQSEFVFYLQASRWNTCSQ